MTFYPPEFDESWRYRLHHVGWKEASTFRGFCASHDQELFRPLESTQFAATREQCFLVGYRALCHELHQKEASLRAARVLADNLDRGRSIEHQWQFQAEQMVTRRALRKAIADLESTKNRADQYLLSRAFDRWSHCVLEFRGTFCLSSTGAISPNWDLGGQQLQTLHSELETIQHLCFAVLPYPEGGVIVFSWPTEMHAPRKFLESLQARGTGAGALFAKLIFAFVENTYFSPFWWNALTAEAQQEVRSLAQTTNAYYDGITLRPEPIVDWDTKRFTWSSQHERPNEALHLTT